MKIQFYKYHAAGNDFILIDDRNRRFPKRDKQLIARLCQRRFGVGADGLIMLEHHPDTDFRMVLFNPDGRLVRVMSGNGGRCIVAFARDLNLVDSQAVFTAADGLHHAELKGDMVSLQMKEVRHISHEGDAFFLDTGTAHHVVFREAIDQIDVLSEGRAIRDAFYGESGVNVDFTRYHPDGSLSIRTYDRGVDGETHSCGTGAVAVVIVAFEQGHISKPEATVHTRGGDLQLRFAKTSRGYKDIVLTGPARFVFEGAWPLTP